MCIIPLLLHLFLHKPQNTKAFKLTHHVTYVFGGLAFNLNIEISSANRSTPTTREREKNPRNKKRKFTVDVTVNIHNIHCFCMLLLLHFLFAFILFGAVAAIYKHTKAFLGMANKPAIICRARKKLKGIGRNDDRKRMCV